MLTCSHRNQLDTHVMTVSDLAERLLVSKNRVKELAEKGEIPSFRRRTESEPLFWRSEVKKTLNISSYRLDKEPIGATHLGRTGENSDYNAPIFFRKHRDKLGEIKAVFLYSIYDLIHPALDGFYKPSPFLPTQGFYNKIITPSMVIQGETGREIWLTGPSTSDGGSCPDLAKEILSECGFDSPNLKLIPPVLRTFKDETGETQVFGHHGILEYAQKYDHKGAGAPILHHDRLVLIANGGMDALKKYHGFIPDPVGMMIFRDYREAKKVGYALGTPKVKGIDYPPVVIQDSSGRQLWLNPERDYEVPLQKQEEVQEIRDFCGLEQIDWKERVWNSLKQMTN